LKLFYYVEFITKHFHNNCLYRDVIENPKLQPFYLYRSDFGRIGIT